MDGQLFSPRFLLRTRHTQPGGVTGSSWLEGSLAGGSGKLTQSMSKVLAGGRELLPMRARELMGGGAERVLDPANTSVPSASDPA